jgi:hypothetical protein
MPRNNVRFKVDAPLMDLVRQLFLLFLQLFNPLGFQRLYFLRQPFKSGMHNSFLLCEERGHDIQKNNGLVC